MKHHTFRATWSGAEPVPGEYLLTRRAAFAYRIEAVTPGRSLTLACVPVPASDLPPEAVLHPWQWRKRWQSGVGAHWAYAAEVAARIRGRKRDAKTAEERRVVALLHDGNPLVPEIRKSRISDGQRVLREPTAAQATWRDPDDDNPRTRAPRMVRGWKRHNVLDRLAKPTRSKAAPIAPEHMRAAAQYTLHAEMAERTPYRMITPTSGLGGTSRGATQPLGFDPRQSLHRRQLAAARKAVGERGTLILDAVVLRNIDVRTFAEAAAVDREVALGMLVATLDRLVEHFGGPASLRPTVFEETRHAR